MSQLIALGNDGKEIMSEHVWGMLTTDGLGNKTTDLSVQKIVWLSFHWSSLYLNLTQNTFEMTNGGESSARHHRVNGPTNKTREEEQGPKSVELKETVSKAQSNTQRVQHDKMTEQYW